MNGWYLSSIFVLIVLVGTIPSILNEAMAQTQHISVRQQWMMHNDLNQITCPTGMGMMMRHNGDPVCFTPSSYMRLVDRGWGTWDYNYMTKDQQFMTGMMNNMMQHPQMMGYMMNHPQMMQAMHGNTQWMNTMHGQGMMGQGMMMGNYTMGCPMCAGMMGGNMNQPMMMHNPWMMQNPQMMHGMMGTMMNDPKFQQQMMNHMMGNQMYMQQLMQNQTFMQKMNP